MPLSLGHGHQVGRHRTTKDALMLWLEHAAFHGSKSCSMLYTRTPDDCYAVRATCEAVLPTYGAAFDPRWHEWGLSSGAKLILNQVYEDTLPAGHGGHALTMLIVINGSLWPEPILNTFASFLRGTHRIPPRYIVTGTPS